MGKKIKKTKFQVLLAEFNKTFVKFQKAVREVDNLAVTLTDVADELSHEQEENY